MGVGDAGSRIRLAGLMSRAKEVQSVLTLVSGS